jgi:hypothetical protein
LETRMHGFELEARSGDIPVDYNYANNRRRSSMKLVGSIFGTTAFVLAVISTDAHAESLRCNDDLAQIGDSKSTVLAKCGEPMFNCSSRFLRDK